MPETARPGTADPQRVRHQALVQPQLLGGLGVETVVTASDQAAVGQPSLGRGLAEQTCEHRADGQQR
ncbi:hypothetical protein [Streptomyces griseoviridis]|uniref:Uncharacterized protein n=1 Tax=Streptomyces griseoviridis TaxID=45398 RepID=A0ABT9LM11_STRGD|nr:hypothetical protein [Streptomyces griseoviridis]MDP9684576.1 hypothetical protein [Streptomyces griseoviridis]